MKYQGPVETTALISYTENPSPEQEAQVLLKRDQITLLSCHDHHHEGAGDHRGTHRLRAGHHVAQPHRHSESGPLGFRAHSAHCHGQGGNLGRCNSGQAGYRGHGPVYPLHRRGYPLRRAQSTHRLLWHQDRAEMDDILETDENFEIVASTLKCIYD